MFGQFLKSLISPSSPPLPEQCHSIYLAPIYTCLSQTVGKPGRLSSVQRAAAEPGRKLKKGKKTKTKQKNQNKKNQNKQTKQPCMPKRMVCCKDAGQRRLFCLDIGSRLKMF